MIDPPSIPQFKPPPPPQYGQSSVTGSGDAYLRAQKGGIASTIATSPQGDLTPALTTKKTILGA